MITNSLITLMVLCTKSNVIESVILNFCLLYEHSVAKRTECWLFAEKYGHCDEPSLGKENHLGFVGIWYYILFILRHTGHVIHRLNDYLDLCLLQYHH